MKKFIYAIVATVTIAITVSSCTEDNVKPSETTPTVGGGMSDPIK